MMMMGFTSMMRSCQKGWRTLRKGSCWGGPDLIRTVLKRAWALPEEKLEGGEGPDVRALFLTLNLEGTRGEESAMAPRSSPQLTDSREAMTLVLQLRGTKICHRG